MKVLVTDANYKHALAAIRSLGRQQIQVIAASHHKFSAGFYSKYCINHYVYSDPKNEDKFISDLLEIIIDEKCDVLLPVGFKTCSIVSKHQNEFLNHVRIPIADYGFMQIASDKNKTIKFAQEHGITVPNTIFPMKVEDLELIAKDLHYPVVIKVPEESGSVVYANDIEQLKVLYRLVCDNHPQQISNGKFPQIQEYIPGEGYGFFALYNNGSAKAIFAHKRIHEYPLSGGPSTMAASIHDPQLKEIGLKLLGDLNWHGVAMAEFRRDKRDNTYKLIEINPKLWGSLDLAIRSGVDFPYLACKMCIDENIDSVLDYEEIVFRWIGPDFIYSVANSSLREFVSHFFDNKIHDDLDFKDVLPTVFQMLETVFELASRIKNHSLK